MMMGRARAMAGITLFGAVAAAAMAACGDDDDTQTPTATATATAAASATRTSEAASPSPVPATPTSPAATATPTTPAAASPTTPGVTRCTTGQLKLEVLPAGAAAGTHFVSLAVTNTSGAPCAIEGYPGVSLQDASGNQLGQPADRTDAVPVQPVTLAQGEAAHAMAAFPSYQNFPAGTCAGPSASIRVFPPDELAALSQPLEDYACPGFSVRVFEPGRNEAGR